VIEAAGRADCFLATASIVRQLLGNCRWAGKLLATSDAPENPIQPSYPTSQPANHPTSRWRRQCRMEVFIKTNLGRMRQPHSHLALGESLAQFPQLGGVFQDASWQAHKCHLRASWRHQASIIVLCSSQLYWGNCESDNFDRRRMERVLRDGRSWMGPDAPTQASGQSVSANSVWFNFDGLRSRCTPSFSIDQKLSPSSCLHQFPRVLRQD